MTTEINGIFEQVRERLKQLGNAVADLAQNHADILDSPNIQDSLLEFRQAYEESVARLTNPNFTIATIGTTSSGKSTIVNALIGRKIAPIEAGEMSGGILTIKHSKEFKLLIEETEEAWQKMAIRYPEETAAGFSVQDWSEHSGRSVVILRAERDEAGNEVLVRDYSAVKRRSLL
ncbi:MAG TPA: dynamin family protein [Coleofasciculaceae cyanobacterium]|jgi:hypothetical protein